MVWRRMSGVAALLALSAYASAGLPREMRRTQYVETIGVAPALAMQRSMAFAQRHWGRAPASDPAHGRVMLRATAACDPLNPSDAKAPQQLRFALDLRTLDRQAKFAFLDLQLDTHPIRDREELEAVKPCLLPVVNGFLQAIAAN